MLHLYGIKNCGTVKKALDWLDGHGVAYTFHDFKKETLSAAMLDGWLKAVGWEVLLNRKGTTWRGLPDKVKEAIDAKSARALMLENPSIIKRPVTVSGGTVIVGFDEEDFAKRFG
ncbi:MAG: ArsC family reductase [Gammaproteobacteria bacterium]